MTINAELEVRIAGELAGYLEQRREGSAFRLSDEYIEDGDRPVLGQVFEDDPYREHVTTQGVPKWFANLLPEGRLREFIAATVGVHETRAFYLLAHLGRDLPGAVDILPVDSSPPEPAEPDRLDVEPDPGLRFSLAGVQLKFSGIREGRGLTIPVHGRGGDWIVKLPDLRFDVVPENEFRMMRWAGEVGIEVPDTDLIRVADITGLPEEFQGVAGQALAVRRFDRDGPERIHIEDFAQVLGLWPHDKYQHANYATIARTLASVAPLDDVYEMVRRLVFCVLIGNADAHSKNWSLIYPNGREARLSPGYDLVSTIPYPVDRQIALTLGGTRRFEDVSIDRFRRFARAAGLEQEEVAAVVSEQVTMTVDSWSAVRSDLSSKVRDAIDAHLRQVPLSRL